MDLGMTLDNIKDIENSREEAKKFTFNLIDSFTSNKTYKFNTHSLPLLQKHTKFLYSFMFYR